MGPTLAAHTAVKELCHTRLGSTPRSSREPLSLVAPLFTRFSLVTCCCLARSASLGAARKATDTNLESLFARPRVPVGLTEYLRLDFTVLSRKLALLLSWQAIVTCNAHCYTSQPYRSRHGPDQPPLLPYRCLSLSTSLRSRYMMLFENVPLVIIV
jgi:hypothetical protein